MDLIKLHRFTISEEKSGEYLQTQGILKRVDQCPYCESNWRGLVRRGTYKCYVVGKRAGPRQGSILEVLRVPWVRVLIAIKLFDLDTLARKAAHQLGLYYNTVYDLFNLFRQSIVRTDSDTSFTRSGEIDMNES